MASFAAFEASLSGAVPPSGLIGPAKALWLAAKGDWDAAHNLVAEDDSREAAWVHAHLHRVEGDPDNAAYWYRRAGQPVVATALDEERLAIARALLSAG